MTDPRLTRIFTRLNFLLPLLLLPAVAIVQESTIRHYDWLTADKVSGSHVLEIRADGTRVAGFTLHRELELYHRAGISTANILRIATIGSAKVAGVADQTGSISEGKQADFVLLEGNPLENISAVRKPVAVFKGDRWFDPTQLYEAIGIKPFTR